MSSGKKLDHWQPTKTKLALYSTAFGLVASGGANGAPTSSAASFTLELDADLTTDERSFDIDGDEIDDFSLYGNFGETCEYSANRVELRPQYFGNVSYYAGLVAGDTVNSGPGSAYLSLMGCFGPRPNMGEVLLEGDGQSARGYVGVRFYSSSTGDYHFGYLDIEVREGSLILELAGACFESEPDTPLEVGAGTGACASPSNGDSVAPTAVPVGVGTLPLGLGLLALGAGSLYRRKRLH